MDEIGIEQARPALGEIVDRARLAERYTVLTRQGKPAAAVISFRCLGVLIQAIGIANPEDAEWHAIVKAVRSRRNVPRQEIERAIGGLAVPVDPKEEK